LVDIVKKVIKSGQQYPARAKLRALKILHKSVKMSD
jgi:hypothetical protein